MSDALFSVADQVVLISGASRGIGRGIAKGFAERGAKVIICSREESVLSQTAQELSSDDNEVEAIVCDVSDLHAIDRLVEQVISRHDRVDTLVNCAGVNRRKATEDLTEEDYDFVIDINQKGALWLSLAVGKHMLRRGKGSQINIASLTTDRPILGVTPYAMSKAAMGHMTRSLAMEWGPRGVRVNALAPGFIWTDMTQKLWSQPHMQAWNKQVTPLQRLGQSEDMVGTAIFLASEASAFMTGQILYVDGGVSAGVSWPIDFEKQ